MSNLALMAIGDEFDGGSKKKRNKWYLDSRCLRHMTGDYFGLSNFTEVKNDRELSFGDIQKEKLLELAMSVKTLLPLLKMYV